MLFGVQDMISVVIPAFNEEEFIGRCISSLERQSLPRKEYEIIVSDSSSTDNTVKLAKKQGVRVVSCKKHSAGYGRNYGAKKAKGELLAFIDADTLASESWLEGVKEGLEGGVACTGPIRALEKDSLLLRAYFRWWSLQSRASVAFNYPIYPGFNFAVRKSAFNRLGGFKTKDITTEDLDLSLGLRKIGKAGFNGKMLVYSSTRRFKEKSIFFPVKNAWHYILFGKSHGWKEHRPDF